MNGHKPNRSVAPNELTASDALARMRDGSLTCEALVRACLTRIEARDPDVRAWIAIDAELALRHARELDKRPPERPLHGLPWGVKDIIETGELPTTYNSPVYFGQRTGRDAACVAIVRRSGALILGKTDTVEFACGGRKALTRNPHDLAHSPGGTSSGSAAAVADCMVPLAFGTQSAGSHIRPAAFNGIYAIKPTHGLVNREGVRNYAPSLDTVGWFARSTDDLLLVAETFRIPERDASVAKTTVDPRNLVIGICRTPMWDHAQAGARAALEGAARRLASAGVEVVEIDLPPGFDQLPDAQMTVLHGEGRASFIADYLAFGHELHPDFVAEAENHRGITPRMLTDAYDLAAHARRAFDGIFGPKLDAILTLGAAGEAPRGLQSTGEPIFNGLWTLLHVPCIAIPGGRGPNRLPLGLQLVGPRFDDLQVLRVARAIAPLIDVDVQYPSAQPPAT